MDLANALFRHAQDVADDDGPDLHERDGGGADGGQVDHVAVRAEQVGAGRAEGVADQDPRRLAVEDEEAEVVRDGVPERDGDDGGRVAAGLDRRRLSLGRATAWAAWWSRLI